MFFGFYCSGVHHLLFLSSRCSNVLSVKCRQFLHRQLDRDIHKHKGYKTHGGTGKCVKTQGNTRPRRQVCERVLEHFDELYYAELGHVWAKAREVLLQPQCWQYAVMLNRFRLSHKLQQQLQTLGYSSLLPEGSSSLQCFIHQEPLRFPSQHYRPGQLKQYYLLNAASLLPVLALGVKDDETVLDMCSAPGGKAVAILQSASPGLLLCNELDCQRWKWLAETLESFVPKDLSDVVRVSNLDGRLYGQIELGVYDKVLVDAPCSNDRSWLFSSQPDRAAVRIQERATFPILQEHLLRSAVAALRPGGVVVYSTCTLSQAENGGVVRSLLASCPHVQLEDLGALKDGLSQEFAFAQADPHGLLVVPAHGRTWGPMFVAKLRKIH
nr:PREDICTED: putative methyltransferase NSUN3 [Lepisosteus oculatus]